TKRLSGDISTPKHGDSSSRVWGSSVLSPHATEVAPTCRAPASKRPTRRNIVLNPSSPPALLLCSFMTQQPNCFRTLGCAILVRSGPPPLAFIYSLPRSTHLPNSHSSFAPFGKLISCPLPDSIKKAVSAPIAAPSIA